MSTQENLLLYCKSHCCVRHGCKYSRENCPVVLGTVEQDDYCEQCPSFKDIIEEKKFWKAEMMHWQLINARKNQRTYQSRMFKG